MFIDSDEPNSVIVYRDEIGPAIWIEGLHISQLMLAPHTPHRLATIAFGLMAIEAYRLGFHQIQLYATGRGPLKAAAPDALVRNIAPYWWN